MAIRAAFREPQRPLLFALAVLIHLGLFQLLVSARHTIPEMIERQTVLVFLPDTKKIQPTPRPVAPLAPEPLPQPSPPESMAPRLIAPPEREAVPAPPIVDWQREAEESARKHALQAEARRDPKADSGPSKPKPEFG